MRLLVFGLGYSARVIAARVRAGGGVVAGTTRDGRDGTLRFDDQDAVLREIAGATHVLSSVPPDGDADPVLEVYGEALATAAPRHRPGNALGLWLGYLSSTGVYGDAGGAWIDESAPILGRRPARNRADAAWLAMGARVFRLPGIYGPGRSALERVSEGKAHRVNLPGQIFSRVHVDDIAAGVVAGFDAPAGAYNLADDMPSDQNAVVAYAAQLLGLERPPFIDIAALSPMARSFYGENRRVSNAKSKRVLGWAPLYPTYRSGLRALSAMSRPMPVSTAPATASSDQR
ncbi:SDR family oxidoreductase [soil metagenome]